MVHALGMQAHAPSPHYRRADAWGVPESQADSEYGWCTSRRAAFSRSGKFYYVRGARSANISSGKYIRCDETGY